MSPDKTATKRTTKTASAVKPPPRRRPAQPYAVPQTATTKLDAAYWRDRLATLSARHRVPGAQLGILRDGAITDYATGVLSKATHAPATPDSVWQIGSISKVWTATLVMQLVDEGLLDLDAPVTKILPELRLADPMVTKRVTTRHLLNHTSGIDGDVFTDTGRGDDCIAKYVELLAEVKQNHPLGATWSYCNSGYSLLGAIIEELTGKTWDEALTERIIEPLGLRATVTLPEQTLLHAAAVGHVGPPGSDPQPTPVMLLQRSAGPAGLITARVHDLLCFARLHLNKGVTPDGRRLLSAKSAAEMTKRQADVPDPYTLGGDSWGLGWIRFDWNGTRLIGHDGSTIGQGAFLRILPGQDVAVALFTNGGNARGLFQDLFGEIFAELAGVQIPAMFVPPEVPPTLDITDWLGTYERAGVRTEIFLADGSPRMRTTETGPLAELDPEHNVEEYPLVAVAENLYGAHIEAIDTFMPVTMYRIHDGTRYVHFGVRANPMVAPA